MQFPRLELKTDILSYSFASLSAWVALVFCLIILLQGCNEDSSFSSFYESETAEDARSSTASSIQSESDIEAGSSGSDNGPQFFGSDMEVGSFRASLSFVVGEKASKLVDLVMVIDNSSSMTLVQNAVQKEITPLIAKLGGYTDARLTIVTATSASIPNCHKVHIAYDRGARFTLPPGKFLHINCAIDSWSDLRSLIRLFETGELAGVKMDKVFRGGALKVFLTISDDGSPQGHVDWFTAVPRNTGTLL